MLERLGLIGRDNGRRRRRGGRTDSTGDARGLSFLATRQSDEIPREGIIELARLADLMVDLGSIVGPAAECPERVRVIEAAGVDEVALVLSAPGGDRQGLGAALAALAPA